MNLWPLLLLSILPLAAFGKCDVYYLSLDFGGAIGEGAQIVDYLGDEDLPFTLFLVGKNASTTNGQKVCEKIRASKNKKIAIGNHTISHEGFGSKHSEDHIRSEILGNEAFMHQCDSRRVVKYFRYPKGSAHPLAEKVLTEAGYLGTYEEFFPQANAQPSKAVWWTADTRDWVKPNGASAWAQVDYYNKNQKLLSVDQDSWNDLTATLKNAGPEGTFNKKMLNYLEENGAAYPEFQTTEYVPGLHGPNAEDIAKKVLNDQGQLGKDGKRHCFPLMHYGGIHSYQAFKRFIPVLKAQGAEFRGLGDGDTVKYQLKSAVQTLELVGQTPKNCPSSSAGSFEHQVGQGENLFSIARMMINTNRSVCKSTKGTAVGDLVSRIIQVNKIKDTNEVIPGTKLIIPTNCL